MYINHIDSDICKPAKVHLQTQVEIAMDPILMHIRTPEIGVGLAQLIDEALPNEYT